MKQLCDYLILFLVCGLGQTGMAQTATVAASQGTSATAGFVKPGANGFFIFLSASPLAPGTVYKIERRGTQEQAFRQIAVVKAPADLSAFSSRAQDMIKINPFMGSISSNAIARIWNKWHRSPDSAVHFLQSMLLQEAAGMIYFDATAEKGHGYVFRVSAIGAITPGNEVNTSPTVSYPEPVIYPKLFFSGYRFSSPKRCTIRWMAKNSVNAGYFILMRSGSKRKDEKGGDVFVPVPCVVLRTITADSTMVTTIDTGAVAGSTVDYRLIATDAFGNIGSQAIAGRVIMYDPGNLSLPENLLTASADSSGLHGVRLSWVIKDPKYIFKVKVYRSESENGDYRLLTELPVTIPSFIDERVDPARAYFYHLTLIGPMGEESRPTINFPGVYYSSFPASVPVVGACQPLPNGISVTWFCNDKEVIGYRVFRCAGFHSVLNQISMFIPAAGSTMHFIDSSKQLNGRQTYGYAVRAENTSHVLSGPSDTVYARPLIPTAPPAPQDITVIRATKGNKLFWKDMRGVEPTVTGYVILRSPPEATEATGGATGSDGDVFVVLNQVPVPAFSNSYSDSTADARAGYRYTIQSVDGFGGVSGRSAPVTVSAVNSVVVTIPAPQGLSGYRTAEGVQLEWQPMNFSSLGAYRLYRYRRGESPKLLATINKKDEPGYLDKTPETGSLYFYYLVAVDISGTLSEKGSEVNIQTEGR